MPPRRARVLDGLKVRREACRDAALGGYANATELADYLVGKGVPFREAHDIVGRLVAPRDLQVRQARGARSSISPSSAKRSGRDVYDALSSIPDLRGEKCSAARDPRPSPKQSNGPGALGPFTRIALIVSNRTTGADQRNPA